MRLRYLGHSAFEWTNGQHTLLFDPFLSGNPVCPVKAEELTPNFILLSHFHGDHLGDTEAIARRTGALVITTHEIAVELGARGLKTHGMGVGGTYEFPFGKVRVTPAFHSSGIAGGLAAGFVVKVGAKRVYYAGDTALFSDMKLLNGIIEEPGIDLALLPVGDNYTMGPREAALAAEWVGARTAIPMHWGTFPVLHGDPADFTTRVARSGARAVVLQPGETHEF